MKKIKCWDRTFRSGVQYVRYVTCGYNESSAQPRAVYTHTVVLIILCNREILSVDTKSCQV